MGLEIRKRKKKKPRGIYFLCQQSTTCHNNFPLCCGGRDQRKQFCGNDERDPCVTLTICLNPLMLTMTRSKQHGRGEMAPRGLYSDLMLVSLQLNLMLWSIFVIYGDSHCGRVSLLFQHVVCKKYLSQRIKSVYINTGNSLS